MLAVSRAVGELLRQDTVTPADPDEGFAALAEVVGLAP
jgi:hypothetical protein